MLPLSRAPPVAGLALAWGFGVALGLSGVSAFWTLFLFPLFLLPIRSSRRPQRSVLAHLGLLLAPLLAGGGWAAATRTVEARDCRYLLREGDSLQVTGWLAGPLESGLGELHPSAPFRDTCRKSLRVALRWRGPPRPVTGAPYRFHGRWREGGASGGGGPPLRAGYLLVDSIARLEGRVRISGGIQARIAELFPRERGLVLALVWARKEGLDPGLREAFARAGVAHLLAISGFHVGVLAGVLILCLSEAGLPLRLRYLLAASGVWLYVAAIGFPDAAVRAALLVALLTGGRVAGRSLSSVGALSSGFFLLLLADPPALLRPGFQLSFAGAAGLAVGYRPLAAALGRGPAARLPHWIRAGVASGLSATLATLPLVAWHFGRVSLVGVPATLLAAPLVAFVIPSLFLTLLLSLLHPALGAFLAGGVGVVLRTLTLLVQGFASLPFASAWVPRGSVVAAGVGAALGWVVLAVASERAPAGRAEGARPAGRRATGRGSIAGRTSLRPASRMRRPVVLVTAVTAAWAVWPGVELLRQRDTVEVVVLDVGQGDALALRSPRGRWVLIDGGPRTPTYDAGARAVVPFLRRRGVGEVEALVLTHPDMDHIGGAASVLREIAVGAVLEPGEISGTEAFVGVVKAAEERETRWRRVGAGDSLGLDGMALRFVAPEPENRIGARPGGVSTAPPAGAGAGESSSNEASIVVEVRFGAFTALLTGDAPADSEARFLPRLLSDHIQVLKVGHHGSLSSTSVELLSRTTPEVALLSVGRRNRYGHPHPVVIQRLRRAGAKLVRTDRQGTIEVRARRDGTYRVKVSHR